MSADAKRRRSNAIQEIFWTRTGLLLAVLIVVSGSCLMISSAMDPGTWKNVIHSLGTGALVSAVVGFGQTLITATASQRALVAPVVEESRRTLQELSAEYRSLNREFFPTHVFEATTRPDPEFNQVMMQDLRASKQYFFRGFSGRYAATRLLHSQSEREMRVVIADPTDATTVSGRTRYLARTEGAITDFETIQQRLHHEIWVGLVGLFLARACCIRIDITVVPDPPLDRLELFDESAWITLYSDANESSALYPRTLRFAESSFIYGMERTEFLRMSAERSGRHFQLRPDTMPDDFAELFKQITGAELSEDRFRELESGFQVFRQEFSAAAELGS